MVWSRHRYDQDTLGPYSLRSTSGPITAPLRTSGENFQANGVVTRVHGMGFHARQTGSMYCSATAAVIDSMLDTLAERGINHLSLMEFDLYAGTTAGGRPAGCWTSTAYTSYQESFWRGDGTSAGFDYFFNACKQRGIYITLRFDQWGNVLTGAGFTMPRLGGSYVSTTQKFHGHWWMDGTYGPNLKAAFKAHIAVFLNRVNSITGIRYGDDPTLSTINALNELGISGFYWATSSTSSPSSFTFDKLVANTTPDAIHTTYVQAFDAKYTAWHNAKFGSNPTWNGVSSTVLPCFAFTGAEGGTVPARPAPKSFKLNYTTNGATANTQRTERMRVAQFIEELERDFQAEIKAYILTLASNVLYNGGQGTYTGALSDTVSDVIDTHCYHYPFSPATSSNGNYQRITGCTWTWGAGTLSGTLGSAPDSQHPLTVGMPLRIVADANYQGGSAVKYWQPGDTFSAGGYTITADNRVYRAASITTGITSSNSAGPTGTGTGIVDGGVTWDYVWSAVAVILTTGTTTTFTAATSDPGASLSGVVICPGSGAAYSTLHGQPAGDTASTRFHADVNGTYGNVDVAGGLCGDATSGGTIYQNIFRLGNSYRGKPRYCTELGVQSVSVIGQVQHPLLYNIWDTLAGGNGFFWFSIDSEAAMLSGADHRLQQQGVCWLLMELITLMNRYGQVPRLATEDLNIIQAADLYDWWAKHTAPADASYAYTATPGYSAFTTFPSGQLAGQDQNFFSFSQRRCRYEISETTTSKSSWAPTITAATGGTLSELTDPAVCKVYWHRNMGYLTVETPYICLAVGRFPGTGMTQMSKLNISVIDQTAWYGMVAWVSSNGVALGASGGQSRVYTMMYPRAEGSQFAAISRNGSTGFCAILDQQFGFSNTDAAISPGVELRNGLELQLTSAVQLGAKRLVRGTVQDIYAGYRSGAVHLRPLEPRIFLE